MSWAGYLLCYLMRHKVRLSLLSKTEEVLLKMAGMGGEMVPLAGFELATYRLQGGCSTPELKRHVETVGISKYRDRN